MRKSNPILFGRIQIDKTTHTKKGQWKWNITHIPWVRKHVLPHGGGRQPRHTELSLADALGVAHLAAEHEAPSDLAASLDPCRLSIAGLFVAALHRQAAHGDPGKRDCMRKGRRSLGDPLKTQTEWLYRPIGKYLVRTAIAPHGGQAASLAGDVPGAYFCRFSALCSPGSISLTCSGPRNSRPYSLPAAIASWTSVVE